MSISIGAGAPAIGQVANVDAATPSERRTDQACAAQDSATETLSQGIARHRSNLDRLIDQPSPLARFDR